MSLILKDQPRIPHRNFSQKRLKITIPKDQAIVVNEQQMQALQVEAASKLIFSKLEQADVDTKCKGKLADNMCCSDCVCIEIRFNGEAVTSLQKIFDFILNFLNCF